MAGETGVPMADVRDMYAAHTMFRREFGLAQELVRAVGEGNTARAEIVASHLDVILSLVVIHHEGEDLSLWPRLLDRAGEEMAPVIALMERQHAALHALCDEATSRAGRWRVTAYGEDTALLAEACGRLNHALLEHMSDEEQKILPLAVRYVTAEEWREIGEHALSVTPKKQLPLGFGMTLYEGDPEVIQLILKGAPPPVRVIMPVIARRAFRAHSKKVYGTPTPPRAAN